MPTSGSPCTVSVVLVDQPVRRFVERAISCGRAAGRAVRAAILPPRLKRRKRLLPLAAQARSLELRRPSIPPVVPTGLVRRLPLSSTPRPRMATRPCERLVAGRTTPRTASRASSTPRDESEVEKRPAVHEVVDPQPARCSRWATTHAGSRRAGGASSARRKRPPHSGQSRQQRVQWVGGPGRC